MGPNGPPVPSADEPLSLPPLSATPVESPVSAMVVDDIVPLASVLLAVAEVPLSVEVPLPDTVIPALSPVEVLPSPVPSTSLGQPPSATSASTMVQREALRSIPRRYTTQRPAASAAAPTVARATSTAKSWSRSAISSGPPVQ